VHIPVRPGECGAWPARADKLHLPEARETRLIPCTAHSGLSRSTAGSFRWQKCQLCITCQFRCLTLVGSARGFSIAAAHCVSAELVGRFQTRNALAQSVAHTGVSKTAVGIVGQRLGLICPRLTLDPARDSKTLAFAVRRGVAADCVLETLRRTFNGSARRGRCLDVPATENANFR